MYCEWCETSKSTNGARKLIYRIYIPLIFLAIGINLTVGSVDFSSIKLKPESKENLTKWSNLGRHEKRTGCMCPESLNTTGSLALLCGHEFNAGQSEKCNAEAIFRCLDGHKEAIMKHDCANADMLDRTSCATVICKAKKYTCYPPKNRICSPDRKPVTL